MATFASAMRTRSRTCWKLPAGSDRLCRYCRFALTAFEFARRLTQVTLTEAMEDVSPCTLKLHVSRNWLPNGADAVLPNHCENRVSTGALICVVCKLEPGAPAKVNNAWVISRELA